MRRLHSLCPQGRPLRQTVALAWLSSLIFCVSLLDKGDEPGTVNRGGLANTWGHGIGVTLATTPPLCQEAAALPHTLPQLGEAG